MATLTQFWTIYLISDTLGTCLNNPKLFNTQLLTGNSPILRALCSLQLLKFKKAKCPRNSHLVGIKCYNEQMMNLRLFYDKLSTHFAPMRIELGQFSQRFSVVLGPFYMKNGPAPTGTSLGIRDMIPQSWRYCCFWTIWDLLPRFKGPWTLFVENN